jgi:hypothetical protein
MKGFAHLPGSRTTGRCGFPPQFSMRNPPLVAAMIAYRWAGQGVIVQLAVLLSVKR